MTKIYGLLGRDLTHSYSPLIHNLFFKKANISGKYLLLTCAKEDLQETLHTLSKAGLKGINVTIPYKEEIIPYLTDISPPAHNIGAINTITIRDGKLYGDNTDYYGFGLALKKNKVSIEGKTAAILGTGGSAKAIALYLADNNVQDLLFVSRDPNTSQGRLGKDYRVLSYQELNNWPNLDILINCTPVGMYPNPGQSPLPKVSLKKFSTVFDLIYNPYLSQLLRDAHEMGAQIINGLYMLVAQGIKAQELWNNFVVADDIIEQIYENINKELLIC